MAEVMYNQDGTRIVLINRKFGDAGRDMKELRVRFTKQGAMFFHFTQDAEPKNYGISAAEADAFVETWLAYRTEQKAKEQTEEERKQALIDEAYAIAAKLPAIKIDQYDDWYFKGEPAWKVSVPAIEWGHANPVSELKGFLDLVKAARNAYQDHLKLMAESKATA